MLVEKIDKKSKEIWEQFVDVECDETILLDRCPILPSHGNVPSESEKINVVNTKKKRKKIKSLPLKSGHVGHSSNEMANLAKQLKLIRIKNNLSQGYVCRYIMDRSGKYCDQKTISK